MDLAAERLEMKIKITIFHKEPHIREFHLRQRLTEYPEYYDGPGDVFPENFQEGYKNFAYLLAKELFTIAGVQQIMINGYIIEAEISRAYSWKKDKIQERLLNTIRKYIAEKSRVDRLIAETIKKSQKKDSR